MLLLLFVFFLGVGFTEVAAEFITKAQTDDLLSDYAIIAPEVLGSRDQNSVIFLSKALFDVTSVVEISKTVEANCDTKGLASV